MLVSRSNASWKSEDRTSGQFPTGLRVLLVDDDNTCLKIVNSILKKCGYEVTQKSDAESALDLLRKNKNGYDIVISDGVTHGACDFLIKPISIESFKNIWQHVVREKKQELKEKEFEGSGISEDGEQQQISPEEIFDYSSSVDEVNYKKMKKRKEEEEEDEERDDTSILKKPRVVWSNDLHQQFVNAVHQLGIEKAVPKKILELMNVPGLTREKVASHLQKFRLYLRKASQHQSGHNNAFMGPPESSFGPISSMDGLNRRPLTATGQIPSQSLATFQAVAISRPTTTYVPIVDQRNIFNFGTPKLTSEDDQQQPKNNVKQMNLFHRISSSMEPKQFADLHPFVQSSGDMNMQVIPSGVHGPAYSPLSQPSTPLGNGFPLMSNSGMSTLTSKGMLQEEANSEMQQSRGPREKDYLIWASKIIHFPDNYAKRISLLPFSNSQNAQNQSKMSLTLTGTSRTIFLSNKAYTLRLSAFENMYIAAITAKIDLLGS
ncbi:unnamed protein product [Fraxinus pennsylvanica]|uniref:Two-component response regulator n=1 Tax=Fraxinus pennsylvanica TaxID=56036 RepID=A0AAD2DTT5_9LAMI|nr:unnamed protein product [Fraxinus pennsylvanica]